MSDSDDGDEAAALLPSTPIVLSSTDDEDANKDLTLDIIERAKFLREKKKKNNNNNSEGNDVAEEVPVPPDVAVCVVLSSDEAERSVKKKKKRKKRKKRRKEDVDQDDDVLVVEPVVIDGDAALREEQAVAPRVSEITEVTPRVSEITEVDGTPDNLVFKKLLRLPRYFDSEGCNWHFCRNCNEEGHTAANCLSEKRQKPCFVCGVVGHNPRKCTQGLSCSICQRRGHTTKDCPNKENKSTQNSKICLRCGGLGHDMFKCSSIYAPEDLKDIQCYICKKFGHLCCVDAIDTDSKVIACYKCGRSGHSGVGCAKQFQKGYDDSPTYCYKCGEKGHFARGCTNTRKSDHLKCEASTPVVEVKRKRDFAGSTSVPNDLGKASKKQNETPVLKVKRKRDSAGSRSVPNDLGKASKKQKEKRNTSVINSRVRGGWIVDDPGDFPRANHYSQHNKSPSTSSRRWMLHNNQYSSPNSHRSPMSFPRAHNFGSAEFHRHGHINDIYRVYHNDDYRPIYNAPRYGNSVAYYY